MNSVFAYILKTLAVELLVPLVKELIKHIVDDDTKGVGITDADYTDIAKMMGFSSLNDK